MKLVYDFSVTSLRRRHAPVLALDFAAQTYRASGSPVALSSVVSFARGSTAMRVAASGQLETVAVDVPRFDHAFGTGAPLGVLIESSATNVLDYSNDFAQSYWTPYASKPTFTSEHIAPDGTASARSWNCSLTMGGAGGARGGILVVNGSYTGTATASVWLKASAPLTMRFGHSDSTSMMINVTSEWQRFTYTAPLPNGQSRIFMLYEDVNTDIDVSIWGAQTEIGGQATSVIQTSGSPASRAADVVGLTGISGVYDVTLTYDDNSTETLVAQTITEGWWPSLSRPRVKKLVVV
jgi:hypothetical protein